MLSWPCNLIYLPSDGWSYPQQGRWRAPPGGGGRGEQEESVIHPALALSLYLGSLSAKPDPDTSINLVGIPPPTPAPSHDRTCPLPQQAFDHPPASREAEVTAPVGGHPQGGCQTDWEPDPPSGFREENPPSGWRGRRTAEPRQSQRAAS